MRRAAWLAVLLLALGASAVGAVERRVALVIGNGAYTHASVLPNPANDASGVAAVLRDLGFEVEEGIDLDRRAMEEAVSRFARRLDGADAGLFFYAGHGLQVRGANYLVPVDAQLEHEADLPFQTVPLDYVLARFEGAGATGLVLLDACRDNPLARRLARSMGATRSAAVGRGLAPARGGLGTLIAYATDPDNVASDGEGDNSPFSAALIEHLATPGLEVRSMLSRVRQDVIAAAGGRQVPWTHESLLGEVYLRPAVAPEVPAVEPGPTPTPAPVAGNREAETSFWDTIKQETDPAYFEEYLRLVGERQFAGIFTGLAELKLKALRREAPPAEVRPVVGVYPERPEPGHVFHDCAGCPEMVALAGGTFPMGSPDEEAGRYADEGPQHEVTVAPLAIGKYEVTFAEWDACVAAGGCSHKPDDGGWGRGRRPVIDVSWNDARQYVAWLSRETGATYRLPSEAEWEYAARAGTTTRYWWGDGITHDDANCGGNVGRTDEVGSYPANPWGLHDTLGNVWEWIEDRSHDSYEGAPSDGSAWLEGTQSTRVVRGGSWGSTVENCRSACRYISLSPNLRTVLLGFRVARMLNPQGLSSLP